MTWCMNEPGVWKAMRYANDADILARAMPRVMAVVTGEVKWSEASAGDKAVWKGRARNPELAHRRVNGYANVYDTIKIVPQGWFDDEHSLHRNNDGHLHRHGNLMRIGACAYWTIFGNCNIGNQHLTNMQVAGQFWFDRGAVIEQMYAVTDRPITAHDDIVMHMIVGCMPVRSLPLHEWCVGIPGGDFTIPVRQNFGVQVAATSRIQEPLEIRVHLEGWLLPTDYDVVRSGGGNRGGIAIGTVGGGGGGRDGGATTIIVGGTKSIDNAGVFSLTQAELLSRE